MANFKIEDFFQLRSVTPSSLEQDNLVQFSYKSPNGVHDKKPLVLVLEKRGDRFFGINLHYDMAELQEAVRNTQGKILKYLEEQYFRKYPENKKKLNEERKKFDKSLLTEAEYKEMMNKFPRKDLEQFIVSGQNKDAIRQYLYIRMTTVSKLVWKT